MGKIKKLNVLVIIAVFLSMLTASYGFTAETTEFYLTQDSNIHEVNSKYTINLRVESAQDIYGFEALISYNPQIAEYYFGTTESKGTFSGFSINHKIEEGKLCVAFTRIGKAEPINGNVDLYTLKFKALKKGNAETLLESIKVIDDAGNLIEYVVNNEIATTIVDQDAAEPPIEEFPKEEPPAGEPPEEEPPTEEPSEEKPEEEDIIKKILSLTESIEEQDDEAKLSNAELYSEYENIVLTGLKDIEDEELAIKQIAALITAASVIGANSSDERITEDLKSSIIKGFDRMIDIINKSDSVEGYSEIVESVIKPVSKFTNISDFPHKEKRKTEGRLVKSLEKLISKKTSWSTKAKELELGTGAAVNAEDLDEIINCIDNVISYVKDTNSKLKESGIEKEIEKVLTINIDTSDVAGTPSLNVDMTAEIINKALEKGIEKIKLKSDIAAFELPTSFISENNKASQISIKIEKVDPEKLDKSLLTEEQKALLDNQDMVYDINLLLDNQKVKGFNNTIKIRIPYELKEGEDKDNITILYISDQGTIENMTGKYDDETKEIIFLTNHLSKYLIKNIITTFEDVKESFWAKVNIESLASKGIINGKPGGIFDPDGNVTRAEFAKMVTLAMGIVDESAKCTFNDVLDTHWHYKYVASAAKAGIILGRPGDIFAPEDKISRQEMAVIIYRALGETPPKNLEAFLNFNDKAIISDWAKEGVSTVVRSEIITGKPGNIMDPNGFSTRAEAAAVIYRFFNY